MSAVMGDGVHLRCTHPKATEVQSRLDGWDGLGISKIVLLAELPRLQRAFKAG